MYKSFAWWRHHMKTFPRYWPFVRGIHWSSVNSLHKGQWRGALVLSLIYAWMNNLVNNREAGDLRRHRPHYGVTVMRPLNIFLFFFMSKYKTIHKTNPWTWLLPCHFMAWTNISTQNTRHLDTHFLDGKYCYFGSSVIWAYLRMIWNKPGWLNNDKDCWCSMMSQKISYPITRGNTLRPG